MREPGALWLGEATAREGILRMEKIILETGRVGQAMAEALFLTEVEAGERAYLSHQDHPLGLGVNTGRAWDRLVSFRIREFGIITMETSTKGGIIESWGRGDKGVSLEEGRAEVREDNSEILVSPRLTWVEAEGNLTRVSIEVGGGILVVMIVREGGAEEEEVQEDSL